MALTVAAANPQPLSPPPAAAVLKFPEIHDIAPPLEPMEPAVLPWVWWLAAGLLALILLAGLVWWLRAAGRRLALPGLPGSPERLAVRDLEKLRGEAAGLSSESFAERLTGIVRTFLHRQTGILANYATSPEILGDRSRPGEPPPPPVIRVFREILTAADALKYGPVVPDQALDTESLIRSAIDAVKQAAHADLPPPLPEGAALPFTSPVVTPTPPPLPDKVTS